MHTFLLLVLSVSAVRAQVGDDPAPPLPAAEAAVAPGNAMAPLVDAPQVVATPRGSGCGCGLPSCGAPACTAPTCGCEPTCAAPCVLKPKCTRKPCFVTKPKCCKPTCSAPTCGCEPVCGCEAPKSRCLKCVCKPKVCHTCKPCKSRSCVCKPQCQPCGGHCGGGSCGPCGGGDCGQGYCGAGGCGDGYGGGQRLSMAARIQQARIAHPPCGDVFGMMPQTCYNPPYGCYAGTRFNNRYPAFHGTFYRDAYNYRNYFDYPWHAEMHEPTSRFSYNTEPNSRNHAPLPAHAQYQNVRPQPNYPTYPQQAPQYQARPVSGYESQPIYR